MIHLSESKHHSVELVGGKAFWLGSVYNDLNVPPGICITTGSYILFISRAQDEINKLLKGIKVQPILIRKNLACIREILLNQQISGELISEIVKCLNNEGIDLKDGVAVRSSAVNEDLQTITNAGMYPSHLNIDSIEKLENSIKNIWVSSFTEQAFIANNYEPPKIAVIVQKMIQGDKYGVLFSHDPNEYDSNTVILEYSKQNRFVVNGQKPDVSLRINRTELEHSLNPYLDKEIINSLRASINTAISHLKSPVDMEWCEADGKFHVFQVRPLKVKENENIIENLVIINSDDYSECSKYDLLNCKSRYIKHLGKHSSFRKLAKDLGIKVYNSNYLIYNSKTLDQLTEEKIEKLIPSGLAMVSFGMNSKTEFCNALNIKEVLLSNEIKDQPYTCAHIGENIPAELSGYVTLTKDNYILIEYLPGGIQLLKNGSVSPTKIIYREGEKLKYLERPFYEVIIKTSLDTFRYEEYKYNKKAPALSESEIRNISNYCLLFSQKIPYISLEWYMYNNELYAKDVSFENKELEFETANSNVISPGMAKGRIIEISNIQKLEQIASEYSPSLISHTYNDEIISEDPYIQSLIEEITCMDTDVILKVDYPTLGLLPLLDYIKGVVFREGSLLCHIGIALRNKNIPALISKKAFENIKHQDNIVISENGAKIIAADNLL